MSSRPESFVFIGGTSEPGGIHVHTASVAMAVAATGRKVTILCPSVDYFSSMFFDHSVEVKSIPARHPSQPALAYWRQHLAPHRAAVAVLVRGGIGEGLLADLVGIRIATRRLVTIEHRNYDAPWHFAWPPRLHGLVMRLTTRTCIVVSEEIAHTATSLMKVPRSRVVTCVNWVEPEYRFIAPRERAAARAHFGFSTDTIVVGYHGRLAPEKRIDALVDAIAAMRSKVLLAIVGEGWKRKEIEERVASRGVADRVRFLGWHPDPARVISTFDIAVLPSLSEGFPLGLMEAMATGVPCLVHPMSSTKTLIRSGENGVLADLSDPAAFSRALEGLVELSVDARERLGAEAARTIERDYSRARRLPDVLRALDIADPDEAVAALPTRVRRLDFVRPAS